MSTWVLLRGWTRDARHWGEFLPLFTAAVSPDAVHALDLPGTGHLRTERSPLEVTSIVERCRAALAEQGVSPPYRLLGLSLGGMVAMDWAARHGGEVERCVLLATSARPFCPFHERLRIRRWAEIVRIAFMRDAGEREAAILALMSARAAKRAAVHSAWTRYAAEGAVRFGNVLRQLVAAARYRAPDPRPAAPLLLLAGGGDRLVDPRCSENLARRWSAPLHVHPSAGHDLALDAGDWVADRVTAWLRALEGGR